MQSPFAGELLGTMVMIILGNGIISGALLKGTKAEHAGWLAITTGWGFAVMSGIFVAIAAGSKDAHLNPAVTIAFAVLTGDGSKLLTYVPAQFIGAFIGAVLVWLHYLPHWRATEDQGAKLACFATGPAIRDPRLNALSEIIATFLLILSIAALSTKDVDAPAIQPGLSPYLVSLFVAVGALSLGGTTGYAVNPARDLGPRIAHALLPIAGKGGSDWAYAAVPVLGPVVGAILAGAFLRVFGP